MHHRRSRGVAASNGVLRRPLPRLPLRAPRTTPLAIAIGAILYPGTLVLAQGKSGAGEQLEEVIVTATRRQADLQQVPQSITALSTDFIQRQSLTNLTDLAAALPSLNVVSTLPGQNSLIIRGVTTGASQYRIDSTVAVYLDDQPMTSITQQVDVFLADMERVELLPGPQGTLFGSSAQAGTLAYVTNKPNNDGVSGDLELSLGTTSGGSASYGATGWINFPVSENFAVRAVGFYNDEGGFVDNVVGPTLMREATNEDIASNDQNSYRQMGGRIMGLWTINPNWSALLTGLYQQSKTDGTWDTDPFLGDNKITRFFDEWRDEEWYSVSGTLKGDLGFAELSVTASYLDRKIDYELDNTNYAQWRTAYYGAYSALYDTGTLHSVDFNFQTQDRWSYEARLASQGESKLQWMLGAFYEDAKDQWDYGARMLPPGGLQDTAAWEEANLRACELADPSLAACPLAPTDIYYFNNYRNRVRQLAFFGELTYSLTDKWSVTGGMRWFRFDRDTFDKYNVPLGLPVRSDPDANGLSSQGTESDTSLKFATNYNFTPDVMVYALYSEGFRLGGENSARAAATGEVPSAYGPDRLANYEVGLKSEWLDNTLRFNLSVFYMKWEDIQLRITGTSSASGGGFWLEGNFNGNEAVQKGVELNGEWQATDRLNFAWSAFWADPEFTEDTFYPNSEDIYVAKGSTMPVSPEEKYWASVEYYLPRSQSATGDFFTRFSYSWTGETWNSLSAIEDDDRDLLLPPWKSGTLQFGYDSDSDWTAKVLVENLFDNSSINWMSERDYGAFFGDPRWRYIRGLQRPRTITLSFSKKW